MGEWGHITPSDGSSMVGEELVWGLGSVGESQVQLPYTTIGILQETSCNEYWYFSTLHPIYIWNTFVSQTAKLSYVHVWLKIKEITALPEHTIWCSHFLHQWTWVWTWVEHHDQHASHSLAPSQKVRTHLLHQLCLHFQNPKPWKRKQRMLYFIWEIIFKSIEDSW